MLSALNFAKGLSKVRMVNISRSLSGKKSIIQAAFNVSPALSVVVGASVATRQDALKGVWKYVDQIRI